MKKIFICLFTIVTFSQKDGYWDKERAFTKEILLSSGNRTLVKVDEFSEGATEFVYRIVLIDKGSALPTTLGSVLTKIPDPSGITQGTGGVLLVGTELAGDDTCIYGIFNDEKFGNQFLKDGLLKTACYAVANPITKDGKVISKKNSKCFNQSGIWFGFENKNWVLATKIVLEVIPWIDANQSRGWNSETKKELVKIASDLSFYKKMKQKNKFVSYFIDAVGEKYKYSEYKTAIFEEKNRIIDEAIENSLKKTKEEHFLYDNTRKIVADLYNQNKVQDAISLIHTELIDKGIANLNDYRILGYYYLETKQFDKAEKAFNDGLYKDNTEVFFRLGLAHTYLFKDQISEAKEIHNKYKNYNITPKISWKDQTEIDVKLFEKKGFDTNSFKKILRLLN